MSRFATVSLVIFAIALALGAHFLAKRADVEMDKAWTTDAQAALAQAGTEGKAVLLDFTGSDWCSWCQLLDREVFSKSEFKSYAEKNLVLVKVDFPRFKPQTAEVKRQNIALAERYQIQGYPTIIVLDAKGNKVGELGYMEGGPGPWLAELRKITKS